MQNFVRHPSLTVAFVVMTLWATCDSAWSADLPRVNRERVEGASTPSLAASGPVSEHTKPAKPVTETQAPSDAASPATSAPARTSLAPAIPGKQASVPEPVTAPAAAKPDVAATEASQAADPHVVARYLGMALLIAAVAVPGAILFLGWWKDRSQVGRSVKIKFSNVIWWALALAMASASVAYACVRSSEVIFWDGMIGAWLATLLGIVCGVPVALELDRQRRRAEDELKTKAAERLRLNVLTLLLDELKVVAEQLEQRKNETTAVPVVPLKMSMWTATRDSGNLSAVSEPDLLQVLSEAYRWIAVVAAAEVQHFQIAFGGDSRFPDGSLASETQRLMLQKYLPLTIDFVDAAITHVTPLTATT